VMLHGRMPPDMLPDPQALKINGLTPNAPDALFEYDLISQIEALILTPGTTTSGYNTIAFDDQVLRWTLYRNLRPPYKRESRNDLFRSDVRTLVYLTYSLRPDALHWAHNEDGRPDFRLQSLAAANDIHVDHAHEALSDVMTTIELARMIRQAAPRIYEGHLKLRAKKTIDRLIGESERGEPVGLVSSRFSRPRSTSAPVAFLGSQGNRHWFWNLEYDPREFESDPVDDGPKRWTRINSNESPGFFHPTDLTDLQISRSALLHRDEGLRKRVFEHVSTQRFPTSQDVEAQLYVSFPNDRDISSASQAIQSARATGKIPDGVHFADSRFHSLFMRVLSRVPLGAGPLVDDRRFNSRNLLYPLIFNVPTYLDLYEYRTELESHHVPDWMDETLSYCASIEADILKGSRLEVRLERFVTSEVFDGHWRFRLVAFSEGRIWAELVGTRRDQVYRHRAESSDQENRLFESLGGLDTLLNSGTWHQDPFSAAWLSVSLLSDQVIPDASAPSFVLGSSMLNSSSVSRSIAGVLRSVVSCGLPDWFVEELKDVWQHTAEIKDLFDISRVTMKDNLER
jgi:hypothetical protein